MKKVITLFLLTITTVACVHLKSIPLSSSTSSNNGFYYTLPKTFVNVEFSLKQTKITKGIYFKYAECLGFPSEELIKIEKIAGKTTYSIDKVNITNNAYLDKESIYQLDLNQRFLNKSSFKLEYATNGELSSAELTNESQIIPAIITAANLVSNFSGAGAFLGTNVATTEDGLPCQNLPQFITNELKELSDIDSAILKLLNSGPEGLSQKQLEYRLKELKALKSNIISKFTATIKTKTLKYSFEFDPEKITSPVDILKYNKKLGFERIYTTIPHDTTKINTEKLPFNHSFKSGEKSKKVTVNLVYKDEAVSTAISLIKGEQKEGSFFYRIPANVKYKVMLDNKNLGEAILPIPQMGKTLAAPKNLKNITFKLHPGLGSIYTVSGKADSLRFGEIDSLGKTIFTNKNAKKIKELKEAIEIRNLEKELSGETDSTGEESTEEEDSEEGGQ